MRYATQRFHLRKFHVASLNTPRRSLFPEEPLAEIDHWQNRQMRDHGLHAQAAVEIRLEECMDPADVLAATFRAIASGQR